MGNPRNPDKVERTPVFVSRDTFDRLSTAKERARHSPKHTWDSFLSRILTYAAKNERDEELP